VKFDRVQAVKSEHFLFQPGIWIGEGKISFSASHDVVRFFTRWILTPGQESIAALQEVELHNLQQTSRNKFTFFDFSERHFKVELENIDMGTVTGKGNFTPKTIAWELRSFPGSEGFEVYELQDNGEYFFHADYVSSENFRTHVEGKLWKKG
jgi:hypothetical protein